MMNDGKVYDYAFRVCFEDSYQASAMAKFASENLGKKRAVVINEVSDYGKGLADTSQRNSRNMVVKLSQQNPIMQVIQTLLRSSQKYRNKTLM